MFPLQISLMLSDSDGINIAVYCCIFLYCGTAVIQENSS